MRISILDARLSEALTKSDMLAQPGSRAGYFSSIVGLPVTEQRAGYRPDRANDSHTSVLNTAAIFWRSAFARSVRDVKARVRAHNEVNLSSYSALVTLSWRG